MRTGLLILSIVVPSVAVPVMSAEREGKRDEKRAMFLPRPLDDEWNKWFVGEWETTGETDTGSGKGTLRVELGLNGQFRIHTEEWRPGEMTAEQAQYLKDKMHASDEEIARFKSQPYKAIEIYTVDQVSGETVGHLFDSLRSVARGRGKREGDKETMVWEWASGHKTTRITERAGRDRIVVIQKTAMPDGSVMQEKGEARRKKGPAIQK